MSSISDTRLAIKLAFIGHSDISKEDAEALVRRYFKRIPKRYDVTKVVTIKDDAVGLAARKLARKLGIRRSTVDKRTNENNFLPKELTVASTMWSADRFILIPSAHKHEYSTIAATICKRMGKKYIFTQ